MATGAGTHVTGSWPVVESNPPTRNCPRVQVAKSGSRCAPTCAPWTVTEHCEQLAREGGQELLAAGTWALLQPPGAGACTALTPAPSSAPGPGGPGGALGLSPGDVSALYGTAIPMLFEQERTGHVSELESAIGHVTAGLPPDDAVGFLRSMRVPFDERALRRLRTAAEVRDAVRGVMIGAGRAKDCARISCVAPLPPAMVARLSALYERRASASYTEWFEMANYGRAFRGHRDPLRQIERYDWCHADTVECALDCLRAHVPPGGVFEHEEIIAGRRAQVDMLGADGIVYEFKFVQQITARHLLQVLIYTCAVAVRTGVAARGVLVNARTGEVRAVDVEPDPARVALVRLRNRPRTGAHPI
jgi:hypothetical protein